MDTYKKEVEMEISSLELRTERFVRTQFSVSPTDPGFSREVDLFERGYVDSMGIVELLEFLSEEFGVRIPDDDLLADDFSSIVGIARIVSRNLESGSGTSSEAMRESTIAADS